LVFRPVAAGGPEWVPAGAADVALDAGGVSLVALLTWVLDPGFTAEVLGGGVLGSALGAAPALSGVSAVGFAVEGALEVVAWGGAAAPLAVVLVRACLPLSSAPAAVLVFGSGCVAPLRLAEALLLFGVVGFFAIATYLRDLKRRMLIGARCGLTLGCRSGRRDGGRFGLGTGVVGKRRGLHAGCQGCCRGLEDDAGEWRQGEHQ
jgi:hypothetical protein